MANYQPNTITQHMIDHEAYRIALSVSMILQSILWFTCLYAKRERGALVAVAFLLLTASVITWISLTVILTTATHLILVCICMACFILFIIAFIFLIEPGRATAVWALMFSTLILVSASVAIVILFNDPRFYIPEHIACYAYALVFLSFFTIHTYPHWDPSTATTIKADVEMYLHSWDDDAMPLVWGDRGYEGPWGQGV
jgi:hypothetical protein